jgi:hypothetical protein
MKSMEASFAEMTDKQIVTSYMTLVGMIWAYNETNYFIGRDTELNCLRREARTLRYGDPRRAKLIQAAIEATIAVYRGQPIIRDGEDLEDSEDPVEDFVVLTGRTSTALSPKSTSNLARTSTSLSPSSKSTSLRSRHE